MKKSTANWDRRIRKGDRLLERRSYYDSLARNYKPSSTGYSKAMEITHRYRIKVDERQGGGEAIRMCLHFLLQNKVTQLNFNQLYDAALGYILNVLIDGRTIHYEYTSKTVETKAEVEQLMRENLRSSNISISVREFMWLNSIADTSMSQCR